VVKHKTLQKNMKTPCICNGDTEERHPNFTISVTSLMLCNLLGKFSLLLQLEYIKCSCTACARTHTHTHTKYVLQYSTCICITLSPTTAGFTSTTKQFHMRRKQISSTEQRHVCGIFPKTWNLIAIFPCILYWHKAQFRHAAYR
jgi:hypothetical protein